MGREKQMRLEQEKRRERTLRELSSSYQRTQPYCFSISLQRALRYSTLTSLRALRELGDVSKEFRFLELRKLRGPILKDFFTRTHGMFGALTYAVVACLCAYLKSVCAPPVIPKTTTVDEEKEEFFSSSTRTPREGDANTASAGARELRTWFSSRSVPKATGRLICTNCSSCVMVRGGG